MCHSLPSSRSARRRQLTPDIDATDLHNVQIFALGPRLIDDYIYFSDKFSAITKATPFVSPAKQTVLTNCSTSSTGGRPRPLAQRRSSARPHSNHASTPYKHRALRRSSTNTVKSTDFTNIAHISPIGLIEAVSTLPISSTPLPTSRASKRLEGVLPRAKRWQGDVKLDRGRVSDDSVSWGFYFFQRRNHSNSLELSALSEKRFASLTTSAVSSRDPAFLFFLFDALPSPSEKKTQTPCPLADLSESLDPDSQRQKTSRLNTRERQRLMTSMSLLSSQPSG